MKIALDWLPLLDSVGAWLSTYLLHSSVLLAGALLATRWLGGRHLALQESLLRVAVVGGLLTATMQTGLGLEAAVGSIAYPASTATSTSTTSQAFGSLPPVGGEAESMPSEPEVVAVGARERDLEREVALASRGQVDASASSRPSLSWAALGVLVWALGAALLTCRLFALAAALRRRLKERAEIEGGPVFRLLWRLLASADVDRAPRLTHAEWLSVPIAIGVVGREICLPERVVSRLPRDQQETVLAHELAHLERRDPAWLLAVRLIESVLFLQPLNRLARHRLQELAEYGCDDWAARHTGRPDTLARCLTEVASWNVEESVMLAPTMASGSGLGRRVRRLLAPGYAGVETRAPGWSRPLAGTALVAVMLAVPGFTVLGQEEAPEAPESPAVPAAETVAPSVPSEPSEPSPESVPRAPRVSPVSPAPPAESVGATPVVASEEAVVSVRVAPRVVVRTEVPLKLAPVVRVVPEPTQADGAREVAVAPRVVERIERRQVVRIAPEIAVRVRATGQDDEDSGQAAGSGADHDHDTHSTHGEAHDCTADDDCDHDHDHDVWEREMDRFEDEMDRLGDEIERVIESDLEVSMDELEVEIDVLEDELEESLEEEIERFEEALEVEMESLEAELESVENALERESERLESELESGENEAASRRWERLESQRERIEESLDVLSDRLDDELDRLEDRLDARLDSRLERRIDPSREREIEARIDAMTERLEAEAERLEEMAYDLARQSAVDGVPRLTAEDRERLHAQARRIATAARPSDEEMAALRESIRAMSASLQPSRAEMEELRRALAAELEEIQQRLREGLAEQRRAVEALRRESANG